VADTDDRGVPLAADLVPQVGVVLAVVAGHLPQHRAHARHPAGEPGLHLAQQFHRIVELRVDEVDGLAVQAGQARCRLLAADRRRVADRVVHRQQRLGLHGRQHESLSFRKCALRSAASSALGAW
jgi:hypothetical protein